jgi:uncharacterized damage-inducible protein DinB
VDVKVFIQRSLELQRKDLLENLLGLSAAELGFRPARHANSIGFIVWHMTRVEDGWIQRAIQRKPHLWVADGWAARFEMPAEMRDMGFGYTVQQLDAFKIPPLELLLGYSHAVREATMAYVSGWDPASPTEVRAPWGGMVAVAEVLAQLVWELNQHSGQVAYLRGLQRGLQRPDYMGPLSTP